MGAQALRQPRAMGLPGLLRDRHKILLKVLLFVSRWYILVSIPTTKEKRMGRQQATEIAGMTDLQTGLHWHLRCNHFPPVPLSMLPICEEAIDAGNEDEWDRMIELPEGTLYRGSNEAPAWAIIEGHHLESWLSEVAE